MNRKPKLYQVSHTKMASYRRCLQQFHWKYIDKFFPPGGIGQVRGSAGHAALANWHVYYDQDQSLQAAWDNWTNSGYGDGDDWTLLYESLLRYYVWSTQNDTFKLIKSEQKFDITYDVSPFAGENTEPFVFTGYLDGIVEDKGNYWLLENKFYKRMDNSSLDMDQQVSLYLLAALLMKFELKGAIYNMIRVADTKVAVTEPVVRRRIYRNPAGLERIQRELLRQVGAMQTYERNGGVPYRNATKDCSWDCPFYHPCLSMTDDGLEPTQILQSIVNVRKEELQYE